MKFILQQERLTLFFDSFQANEKLKFTKYRISRKKMQVEQGKTN